MKLFCWRHLRDPQQAEDPSKASFLEEGRQLSQKVTFLAIRCSVRVTHQIDFVQNPGGVLLVEGPTPGTPGTAQIHESRLYVYKESTKTYCFYIFLSFLFLSEK